MAKLLGAGEFRHKVAFQYNAGTQDAAGQQQESWQDLELAYAKIEDMSGSELWNDFALRAIADHVLTVRCTQKLKTLTAKHRVKRIETGTIFNIVNVNDWEEKGIQLTIACKREE